MSEIYRMRLSRKKIAKLLNESKQSGHKRKQSRSKQSRSKHKHIKDIKPSQPFHASELILDVFTEPLARPLARPLAEHTMAEHTMAEHTMARPLALHARAPIANLRLKSLKKKRRTQRGGVKKLLLGITDTNNVVITVGIDDDKKVSDLKALIVKNSNYYDVDPAKIELKFKNVILLDSDNLIDKVPDASNINMTIMPSNVYGSSTSGSVVYETLPTTTPITDPYAVLEPAECKRASDEEKKLITEFNEYLTTTDLTTDSIKQWLNDRYKPSIGNCTAVEAAANAVIDYIDTNTVMNIEEYKRVFRETLQASAAPSPNPSPFTSAAGPNTFTVFAPDGSMYTKKLSVGSNQTLLTEVTAWLPTAGPTMPAPAFNAMPVYNAMPVAIPVPVNAMPVAKTSWNPFKQNPNKPTSGLLRASDQVHATMRRFDRNMNFFMPRGGGSTDNIPTFMNQVIGQTDTVENIKQRLDLNEGNIINLRNKSYILLQKILYGDLYGVADTQVVNALFAAIIDQGNASEYKDLIPRSLPLSMAGAMGGGGSDMLGGTDMLEMQEGGGYKSAELLGIIEKYAEILIDKEGQINITKGFPDSHGRISKDSNKALIDLKIALRDKISSKVGDAHGQKDKDVQEGCKQLRVANILQKINYGLIKTLSNFPNFGKFTKQYLNYIQFADVGPPNDSLLNKPLSAIEPIFSTTAPASIQANIQTIEIYLKKNNSDEQRGLYEAITKEQGNVLLTPDRVISGFLNMKSPAGPAISTIIAQINSIFNAPGAPPQFIIPPSIQAMMPPLSPAFTSQMVSMGAAMMPPPPPPILVSTGNPAEDKSIAQSFLAIGRAVNSLNELFGLPPPININSNITISGGGIQSGGGPLNDNLKTAAIAQIKFINDAFAKIDASTPSQTSIVNNPQYITLRSQLLDAVGNLEKSITADADKSGLGPLVLALNGPAQQFYALADRLATYQEGATATTTATASSSSGASADLAALVKDAVEKAMKELPSSSSALEALLSKDDKGQPDRLTLNLKIPPNIQNSINIDPGKSFETALIDLLTTNPTISGNDGIGADGKPLAAVSASGKLDASGNPIAAVDASGNPVASASVGPASAALGPDDALITLIKLINAIEPKLPAYKKGDKTDEKELGELKTKLEAAVKAVSEMKSGGGQEGGGVNTSKLVAELGLLKDKLSKIKVGLSTYKQTMLNITIPEMVTDKILELIRSKPENFDTDTTINPVIVAINDKIKTMKDLKTQDTIDAAYIEIVDKLYDLSRKVYTKAEETGIEGLLDEFYKNKLQKLFKTPSPENLAKLNELRKKKDVPATKDVSATPVPADATKLGTATPELEPVKPELGSADATKLGSDTPVTTELGSAEKPTLDKLDPSKPVPAAPVPAAPVPAAPVPAAPVPAETPIVTDTAAAQSLKDFALKYAEQLIKEMSSAGEKAAPVVPEPPAVPAAVPAAVPVPAAGLSIDDIYNEMKDEKPRNIKVKAKVAIEDKKIVKDKEYDASISKIGGNPKLLITIPSDMIKQSVVFKTATINNDSTTAVDFNNTFQIVTAGGSHSTRKKRKHSGHKHSGHKHKHTHKHKHRRSRKD